MGDAIVGLRPAIEPNLKPKIYSLNEEWLTHEESRRSTSQQQIPLKIDHLDPEDLLILKSSLDRKSNVFRAQFHDFLF